MVLVKFTIRAVIPLKHPATTKSLGSFVEEVICGEEEKKTKKQAEVVMCTA